MIDFVFLIGMFQFGNVIGIVLHFRTDGIISQVYGLNCIFFVFIVIFITSWRETRTRAGFNFNFSPIWDGRIRLLMVKMTSFFEIKFCRHLTEPEVLEVQLHYRQIRRQMSRQG